MLIVSRMEPMARYSIVIMMVTMAHPSSCYLLQTLEYWSYRSDCSALNPCQSHCFHCYGVDYHSLYAHTQFKRKRTFRKWANVAIAYEIAIVSTYTLVVLVKLMIVQRDHRNSASYSTLICHSLLPIVDSLVAYLDFYYLKKCRGTSRYCNNHREMIFFFLWKARFVPSRPPRLWPWFIACAANAWFTSLLFSAFWACSIFVWGGCCDNGTFAFNGCCACCCGCILFTSDGIGGNADWVCCIWAGCGVDCTWKTNFVNFCSN